MRDTNERQDIGLPVTPHRPLCAVRHHRDGAAPLIGSSAIMRAVRDRVERVAATDFTVLIDGESGAGKELVARQIHDIMPSAPWAVHRAQLRGIGGNATEASSLFDRRPNRNRRRAGKENSSALTVERCFWTESAIFRCPRRRSFSGDSDFTISASAGTVSITSTPGRRGHQSEPQRTGRVARLSGGSVLPAVGDRSSRAACVNGEKTSPSLRAIFSIVIGYARHLELAAGRRSVAHLRLAGNVRELERPHERAVALSRPIRSKSKTCRLD